MISLGRRRNKFMPIQYTPYVWKRCFACGSMLTRCMPSIKVERGAKLRWRDAGGQRRSAMIQSETNRFVEVLGLNEAFRLLAKMRGQTLTLPAKAKDFPSLKTHGLHQMGLQQLIDAFGPGPLDIPDDPAFVARAAWATTGYDQIDLAKAMKVPLEAVKVYLRGDADQSSPRPATRPKGLVWKHSCGVFRLFASYNYAFSCEEGEDDEEEPVEKVGRTAPYRVSGAARLSRRLASFLTNPVSEMEIA